MYIKAKIEEKYIIVETIDMDNYYSEFETLQ
jgi:hypothetical protein